MKGGPRLLRICTDSESRDQHLNDVQIGFPILPEIASPVYFDLLRTWIHQCNDSHECHTPSAASNNVLPTRLLYVGCSNSKLLALKETATHTGIRNYVALSHCWGDVTKEQTEKFWTSTQNIQTRQKGFSINELPKTFRDAIRVTRELGQEYLWIDSLCILQDDTPDWQRESKLMESVFSSAYCVIAASSATSSLEGFLERDVSSNCVSTTDAMGRQIYVCEDKDDFDNDVNEAGLNKRGWVLQERVLSRRTIHFSKRQTYWECGEGVRCENLNLLTTPEWGHYFLLDPIFPTRLLKAGTKRTVAFFNSLIEDYSVRGLSEPADRAIAIAGLQSRIAKALGCEHRHGILDRFLHRNLLWQRPVGGKLDQILYNNLNVPSWSWMAYQGCIKFVDIPFSLRISIYWHRGLKFDEDQKDCLRGSLGEFWDCTTMKTETQYTILDSAQIEVGWLQYDVENGTDLNMQKFVVIGYTSKDYLIEDGKPNYFILLVQSTGTSGQYRRVGVGLVQATHVSKLEDNVHIV
ncbi:hypothetical protein BP5796_13007 [Coleophoma crateriformis]|uniref:Heterokaryon incompatibility domain-containing protein n=1 Tax=Coleophoma crateriformis TaxID=565419 RepID=A0A3D8Q5J6_9HELO|nr:hypothetical protein BP5796_13007 [Coleophoma crateriformis]